MAGPWNVMKTVARSLLGETLTAELRKHYLARRLRTGRLDHAEKEMALLPRLVAPGATALDIGANIGVYSRLLSRAVGPAGRVHAFEPVPYTYTCLAHNVRTFPHANVVTYHAALTTDIGTCTIVVPDLGMYSIYQARIGSGEVVDGGTPFTVAALSIDALYGKAFERVDFIKCDVEGAELLVMRGGAATLAAHHPTVLCEVGGGCEQFGYATGAVFAWFAERGYTAGYYDGTRLVPCDDIIPENTNPNYIFHHRTRPVVLT